MDINQLSREMYNDIPKGGTLFTIDKIALSVDTCNIILDNYLPWKKDNFITILLFGKITHILIHAEFEPWEKNIGKRCFDAILVLLANNVFQPFFTLAFINTCSSMFPFFLYDKSWCHLILSFFFKLVEWEWAIDFLDKKPFSFIDTSKENPLGFRKYKNTSYSKDGGKKYRTVEKNGEIKKEVKGVQKSLVDIYNRAKKIEIDRNVTRMEIRQQGKHKEDLYYDLLNGSKETAFNKILPIIKKKIKKVVGKDSLILSKHWEENPPEQYKSIFID